MGEEFNLAGYQTVHFSTASVLKERRLILGLSQKQVAERCGFAQQVYQRFESGNKDLRNASFSKACAVLEALEIDIVAFYHGQYVIGEHVYQDDHGDLRFMKTGRLVNEE